MLIWNCLYVPPLRSSPLSSSQSWRTRSPFPCGHSHCPCAHSLVMLLLPYLSGGVGEALRQGGKGGLCLSGCHAFRFCPSEGSGGCGFGVRSFVLYSRRGWDGCWPAPRWYLGRSLGSPGKVLHHTGSFKVRRLPKDQKLGFKKWLLLRLFVLLVYFLLYSPVLYRGHF